MQQLVCIGKRSLEWHEVEAPVIADPRGALVRMLAVATCDLDRQILAGVTPAAPPFPFGHEGVAEIVEVGEDVRAFVPGDRVVVPFQLSCGECAYCARGITGSCKTFGAGSAYGMGAIARNQPGFLADFVYVPRADHMLLNLPDGVAPETAASASDNIPDGWRTVAPMLAERPGAAVLIVGGGAESVPFYAIDVAVALGAGRVDYLDTEKHRLALAESLGANCIDSPPQRRAGRYAITVDASGTHEGLHCALRSTEPDGTCTSVAPYFEATTPLPLIEMYASGVTFKTSRVNARAVMPQVLDLIASGRIHPERVTANVAAWEDAPAALARHERKTVVTRASTSGAGREAAGAAARS